MPATAETLPHPIDAHHDRLRRYGGAFLAGFRNANPRTSYRQRLHRWFAWCDAYRLRNRPPCADRVHLELYCRWFEVEWPTPPLNAGARLRDVHDSARHTDPKTTMRCDRNRHSLDRHATYAIAQYIAGSE